MAIRPIVVAGLVGWAVGFGAGARADEVDDLIAARMRERHIVGVSVAVIDGGRIVKARGYGFADSGGGTPVTERTLFQAGSVSKSVAAVGALRLVEAGKLSLDEDVNGRLRSWKVPENEFTKVKKVTLRGILSHTAGLTVHGFGGYAVGDVVPTGVQVLDGVKPMVNSDAVRVDVEPGSVWRYSGGGYVVMQVMVGDVAGEGFAQYMEKAVLGPVGMADSTYEQPLPAGKAGSAATGHLAGGEAVKGKWHVYPEMAAAGLWTTPTDLAKFAMAVQRAYGGEKVEGMVSPAMARAMLSDQKEGDEAVDGLGFFLEGKGEALRFGHGGRDEGFDALMLAYARGGKGAVVMVNANENEGVVKEIVDAIAKKYGWGEGIVAGK